MIFYERRQINDSRHQVNYDINIFFFDILSLRTYISIFGNKFQYRDDCCKVIKFINENAFVWYYC